MSTRREFLTYASLAALLPALNRTALAAEPASSFSFEQLIEQAQADALKPYSYPSPAHALAS
jgi:glucans biosynthesis protein